MSAPKFTSGPLEVVGFYVRTAFKDGGVLVADLSDNGMHANRAADAALFAAANELYAALLTICDADDAQVLDDHHIKAARAALAKARGEA